MLLRPWSSLFTELHPTGDSMDFTRNFQRLMHLPRRIIREAITLTQLVRLSLINRYGWSQVTNPGGPVVSLTTYGKRSKTVYIAIESIANGAVRPSRLILWVDDAVLFDNLPLTLRRLQKRGLEVKLCKNYGPHTKYYPYVESQSSFDVPLVTADDDMLYASYWLKKLIEANREYPEIVNCYWAYVVPLNENGIEKYVGWERCNSTIASFCNVAMGAAGAVYPPPFLMVLKRAGTAFENCCPKGDDHWLHAQAIRSGYKVSQILPQWSYFSFQSIPGTQQTALCHENVDRGNGEGNRQAMIATYTESDIQLLRADCGLESQ